LGKHNFRHVGDHGRFACNLKWSTQPRHSAPVLAKLISGDAQSFNVDYRRAWFLWPSILHVRNLNVSGSDANVQWQLEVDEARASIELTALLRRELHVTKIQAQGIAFRLRQKIDANAATSDRVAPLPPIPGIMGPPVIVEGPPDGFFQARSVNATVGYKVFRWRQSGGVWTLESRAVVL
jgi:hypothetical protein